MYFFFPVSTKDFHPQSASWCIESINISRRIVLTIVKIALAIRFVQHSETQFCNTEVMIGVQEDNVAFKTNAFLFATLAREKSQNLTRFGSESCFKLHCKGTSDVVIWCSFWWRCHNENDVFRRSYVCLVVLRTR